MECEHCKNTFKTKTSLNRHQKTAIYCLKLQGKEYSKYKCINCDRSFQRLCILENHKRICIGRNPEIREYEEIVKRYEEKLKEKDIQLLKQENTIKELQEKIENLAILGMNKTTNNIQNNSSHVQNNNQRILNLSPITQDHFEEQAQFLTIEHIKDGADGYARYAIEYPLKDRVLCVDFSRRKIKYKDDDGEIKSDPEMSRLSKKLFKALEDRNKKLTTEYINELKKKLFTETGEKKEMSEDEIETYQQQSDRIIDVITELSKQRLEVSEISEGYKPDMYHKFIKNVCSETT